MEKNSKKRKYKWNINFNISSYKSKQHKITPPFKANYLIFFLDSTKMAKKSTEKEMNKSQSIHSPLKSIKLLSNWHQELIIKENLYTNLKSVGKKLTRI